MSDGDCDRQCRIHIFSEFYWTQASYNIELNSGHEYIKFKNILCSGFSQAKVTKTQKPHISTQEKMEKDPLKSALV